MISNRMKKRFSRIVAGLVSAAMTLTMVPDVWLPVYAEIVRDEIANAEIEAEYSENSNDDLLTATDSASAPDNYVPINSEEIQKFSLRTATFDDAEAPENKTQVLLIEDIYPWNSNANSSVLNNLGVAFKKVKTADFLLQDLGNYSVIVFANDQQFSAYNNYSTFKENIERFAELGGVVVFGACDGGWANATLSAELPGGVTKYRDYDYYNYITDNDHPIITAELSDGNKLTDDLLYSNYCSHISFNEDTLPNGSNVILRGSKNNAPTLVEYPYGKGHIIASGLTWEHNYSNYNRFGKRVMDDLFLYALHIANTDVNMQPPIAVSVDAPQSLAASAVGYSPNPFNVKALLKNISEETVNNVQVKIVLPNGLKLSDGSSETIEIGVMDSNAESNVIWKVKASSVNAEKTYT